MTGILLVDKPEGFTSHDVIAKLRGILKERRLGHAGTLDPLATGLLVVFAGRATRAVQFAESQRKCYVAALRPGIITDTQDITGTVISRSDKTVSEDELCKLLPNFTGRLSQVPPMYSAIKIEGKKLYELARKGLSVERQSREVTIHSLEYLGRENGDFLLRIECSKGTYIRTLCHDIGAALGCGAVMSALRRVSSGDFSVEGAYTLEEIEAAALENRAEKLLLPVDSLFSEYPSCTLDEVQNNRCLCGNAFAAELSDGTYRAYDAQGSFLMLGEVENGMMSTIKSFFDPPQQ